MADNSLDLMLIDLTRLVKIYLFDYYFTGHSCVQKLNRIPHGINILLHSNGRLMSISYYYAGKLHGICTTFYPDGAKQSSYTYKYGKVHGLYEYWYPDGQKRIETTYVNNVVCGITKEWYNNGQLYRVLLVNGEYVKQTYGCWDRNGNAIKSPDVMDD